MSRRAVFVLGDSVSVHYGPHLAAMLGEGFDYDRKGGARLRQEQTPEASEAANGGDSSAVLDYLLEEVRHGSKYDILLLNCGLHDIRVDRATGRYQVEAEAYTGNLERIFPAAQAMAHAVLWVSSTPVDDAVHNGRGIGCLRYSSDLVQYNKIARDCAARHGVPVIDLYAFTAGLGGGVYCDHVHYKPEVRALQGAFIAGYLQKFSRNGEQEAAMFPIDHLNRYVSNVDAFVEFYCDILGYRVLTRGIKANGQPYAVLGGAGHELYLSEQEGFSACEDGNFRHVGYALEDADSLLAKLKGRGFAAEAEIIIKPYSRQFYLTDPDGFVIDMIQWTDREGRDKAWEG